MSERVLVTGASGFVGRRLVEYLKTKGSDVLAHDRNSFDVVSGSFPDLAVEAVIHLAARTFVPDSWIEPGDFYRVNAQGTVNVLDFCRRNRARLIYVSGYCYGIPETLPVPETAPIRPNNAYAFSKAAAELACRFYFEFFETPVTILRPFNVYGPAQPRHFLIPRIVEQAVDPAVAQIVVEDDAPKRDYVHVEDVVAAITSALWNPRPGAVFNIGSGKSHSVAEIAKLVCEAAQVSKPTISRGNRRVNDIPDVVADITAIRKSLGWSPSIDLVDGLKGMIAYHRTRLSGAIIETPASLDVPKAGH
jgi:nucleoside-diphosphate-sugar epimerase